MLKSSSASTENMPDSQTLSLFYSVQKYQIVLQTTLASVCPNIFVLVIAAVLIFFVCLFNHIACKSTQYPTHFIQDQFALCTDVSIIIVMYNASKMNTPEYLNFIVYEINTHLMTGLF